MLYLFANNKEHMQLESALFLEKIIRNVTGTQNESLELHEPTFQGNEIKYLTECIQTGWVSSVGKYVDLFEQKLSEYTGIKNAILTSNGTSAIHISLLLSGVKAGDEVLLPALTFVGTVNPILYLNAIPHFVDSEKKYLGVDAEKLEVYLSKTVEMKNGHAFNRITGRKISALIVVHIYGLIADIERAKNICDKYNIKLIEDAAESIGSFYQNKHSGSFGHIAALSFNGNKTITTGGGGAILTNDHLIAKKAKHITTTAKVSHAWKYEHDELGFNYRMPNINAALGCAQIEKLPKLLELKRELAARYMKLIKENSELQFLSEGKDMKCNYWLNTILLPYHSNGVDQTVEYLRSKKINVRAAWKLLSELPYLNQFPKMDLQQSQELSKRIINLPSSPMLVKQ